MSCPARARITAVLATALAGLVVTTGAAQAAPPPEIPADVIALVAGDAVRQADAGAARIPADFSGARAGYVHEVFAFSMDFLQGDETNRPVISAGRWMAGIERGGQVLGTLEVWKPDGGAAELAGFSDDVVTGSVLGTLRPGELFVVDDPAGAYYAVEGRTARPLNDWARDVLPEPADLAALQESVAERHARDVEASAVGGYPPALTVSLMGMTLTVLAGASLAVRARRGRPMPGGSQPG